MGPPEAELIASSIELILLANSRGFMLRSGLADQEDMFKGLQNFGLYFLSVMAISLWSCGDQKSAELEQVSIQKNDQQSQNAQPQQQQNNQNQSQITSLEYGNSSTYSNSQQPGFDDEDRFGEVGKSESDKTPDPEPEPDPEPVGLAAGTILQEWYYIKNASNIGKAICERPHHRAGECASKQVRYDTRNTFAGNAYCRCR